ncbi:MAG: hypothetical protein R3230_00910 [Nitrosopumilaceae archaeon]|nr:hypothetical protein [Nitrosopumilaceae archaeon]
MAKLNDSFTKAMTQFNKIHPATWTKHIHPSDREEICGYLIRMISDQPVKFNVWNAAIQRPNGVEKIDGCVKTLIRCIGSDRSYFVECPTRG